MLRNVRDFIPRVANDMSVMRLNQASLTTESNAVLKPINSFCSLTNSCRLMNNYHPIT